MTDDAPPLIEMRLSRPLPKDSAIAVGFNVTVSAAGLHQEFHVDDISEDRQTIRMHGLVHQAPDS